MRPINKSITLAVAGVVLTCATGFVHAEQVRHFAGKEVADYSQALAVLKSHNHQLKLLLSQKRLTKADLEQIHQMTYTMENAYQKMQQELTSTAEALEALHLASEGESSEKARELAKNYVVKSEQVLITD
ncbi:hypothetical protein FLL45_16850 [Aliikangiella marina]|uniref:Uncharacterized protein n=1 Tax=Aliikangiella marina TaxID=1712262 RepID=A0A545T7G1_9GAMM|nr:DUF6746 family protein [Aliikangiella marina]TQV73122.1 hypothetical protein FLL45_16850 [Aliikangiella marina]